MLTPSVQISSKCFKNTTETKKKKNRKRKKARRKYKFIINNRERERREMKPAVIIKKTKIKFIKKPLIQRTPTQINQETLM